MFHPREFFAGRTTDALRGGIRRDEIGKRLFEILQLLIKPVVFVVKNELATFDVIGVVVPADFLREPGVAFLGVGVRHGEMMGGANGKESQIWQGCGTLSLGIAPASGAIFRSLAENPGRTERDRDRLRIGRTGCRARGAPGYARGGRAPQFPFLG